MTGISFGGIASGIDTDALIGALLQLEARPLNLLEQKRDRLQDEFETYGTLLDLMKSVETSLETLSSGPLDALKATVSNEDTIGVLVGDTAQAGRYVIDNVTQLADNTLIRSEAYADRDTNFGIGTLGFEVGGVATNIAVNIDDNIDDVAQKINDADAGVNAQVVFDGTSYYLELQGDETGLANEVTITSSPNTSGGPVDFNTVRNAQDAVFSINGLQVTSSDNEVEGVIEGLTLDLLATTAVSGEEVEILIERDDDAVAENMQGMVDSINSLLSFFSRQSDRSALEDEDAELPVLFGDSTLRTLQRRTMDAVNLRFDDLDTINALADMGIGLDATGKLALDEEEFKEALAASDGDLESLFTRDGGLLDAFQGVVDLASDSENGIIEARRTGLQSSMDSIETSIERQTALLKRSEETLRSKYAAFEVVIGRLQAQGSALSALPTFGFNK